MMNIGAVNVLFFSLFLVGATANAHNRPVVSWPAGKNALLVSRRETNGINDDETKEHQSSLSSSPLSFFGVQEPPASLSSKNDNLSSSTTTQRTTNSTRPPLTLDLVGIISGAAPLAVAQFGTLLAILHGLIFRFADGLVSRELLGIENDKNDQNNTIRRLIRRCGRRMLALGLAGYNLFGSHTTPRTALATAGTVLLVDRLARQPQEPETSAPQADSSSTTRRDEKRAQKRQLSKQRWRRFMNQCKIHMYSLLAWSGVLTQFFPLNGLISLVLQWSAALAVKDILAPNDFVKSMSRNTHDGDTTTEKDRQTTCRTTTAAVLCQSSGYNMLALTAFLLSLPVVPNGNHQSTNQVIQSLTGPFGLAWIANFYSVTCFFPYVMASADSDGGSGDNTTNHDNSTSTNDDNANRPRARATTVIRRGIGKAFYLTWLLANGAVAATLASSWGRR